MSDDARTLRNADTLLSLGRRQQALKEAGAVLARDPGNAEAQRIVGEALVELERWDELTPLARDAVSSFPDDAWAWRLLALTQMETAHEAEALYAANRLYALAPEVSFAVFTYARVLHAFGRAAEAIPALERALETQPDDIDLHLARATCLWKVGRSREARESAASALRIDPTNDDAQRVLAVFGGPGQRGSDALLETARRVAKAPGDDDNEVFFELAASRALVFPVSVVLGLCVALLAVCVPTGGLWGWRIDTGLGHLAGAIVQALLFSGAIAILGLWLRRMQRNLGDLFRSIVASRMDDGPLSKFTSWAIAGALVLDLIGIVVYATAGDPLGTLGLTLGLCSAYAGGVLVVLFQLMTRGLVSRAMTRPAGLLVLLWPGAIAGVVLLGLFLIGAVLYIIVWSFSGDRLPEPFPRTDQERRETSN
ncbi:tetratricopeptide repeat protein [Microbacterium sp. 20-116]|uniref:tetratricopeptide repeat protein n=1 Tax=Microbacterium sp. 20-116 TaxID=3239883 RepID=UPI0034E24ED7